MLTIKMITLTGRFMKFRVNAPCPPAGEESNLTAPSRILKLDDPFGPAAVDVITIIRLVMLFYSRYSRGRFSLQTTVYRVSVKWPPSSGSDVAGK